MNPNSHSVSACIRGSIVLGLAAVAATLSAQPSTTTTSTNTAPDTSMRAVKHVDRSFVEDAAKAGAEEVALSRVALERATNPEVKAFAQMMVDDHTGANSELMTIAASKSIALPTKEANTDKWTKKSAKSFDEDYMEKMVSDHKDVVSLFDKESKKGSDSELTAFATKTLPKLREHLAKAEELKKTVK